MLAYYLTLPFLYLLAWLPLGVLYVLGDIVFVLIFHLARYRRAVVRTNLQNSFPEKSPEERARIERTFYRWFCDLLVETLKTLTISPEEVKRRVRLEGEEVLRHYHDRRQSVILVMGHWGNWELGGARFSQIGLHQLFVIYHPLHNPGFERLIVRMRTRLGNRLYAMEETMKGMVRDRHQVTATAFIADQTPPPERAYWTTFLHQDTPVFWGTEKIARKLGYPVLYVGIDRMRRGHYVMRIEELVPAPKATADGEISERHTRRLEEDIRRKPEFWLWTHRRWKHARPPGVTLP
ncbi:MAG: lysophospholipid acyltransferase family protein [Flavobacteriales bacterium]|nr:lysophospholipid acyltransferase family protein [Flavobacteriales bacterium]